MPKVRAKLDLARFHAELQKRDTVALCAALFKQAISQFGFTSFACGEVDLADRNRNVFFHIDWPESWIKAYVKSHFLEQDPIINALNVYRKAFTWSDIVRDRRFSKMDPKVLAVVRENEWGEGLVMPVSRGGTMFGLVSLLGRPKGVSPPQRAQLCLISECFLTRVRSLSREREFPVPPAGLTKRQVVALRLVATGCSDAEIADALGISESTAHQHVEAARKQLKAKTRAHMAAIAVSLGIIEAA
jgi:DNA-binding CsgD family transcriptional regulator